MVFIDSHAHLEGERYADLPDVLQRAKDAGVTHMVCIGASEGMRTNHETLELVARHENMFAAVGVHPHDAKIVDGACLAELRVLAGREKVVALGETGLDYHYDLSPREQQREAFRAQLALARELGLPVVIHTREADDDTIAILREARAETIGGVIHCFTGTPPLARAAVEMGFYVSFSGVLTFKNAEELRDIARGLPRDRVLVETDCPFLAPIPFRGKRNEPAYVLHTAAKLAELWGAPLDDVKRQTGENAVRCFRLPIPL